MNSLNQHLKSLTIAEAVFAAPIIFAYVIGSLPVLIPILLLNWLLHPTKPGADELLPLALAQAA
jgi:hypothetical protein